MFVNVDVTVYVQNMENMWGTANGFGIMKNIFGIQQTVFGKMENFWDAANCLTVIAVIIIIIILNRENILFVILDRSK